MNRNRLAISKLAKRLMYDLSSMNGYCHNYISYCYDYATATVNNDLSYDEKSDRYYNIDWGDDIEIPSRLSKTGNPVTIDISEI